MQKTVPNTLTITEFLNPEKAPESKNRTKFFQYLTMLSKDLAAVSNPGPSGSLNWPMSMRIKG